MAKWRALGWIGVFVAAAAAFVTIPTYGQIYPSKPIKLIVPFPPGGATDVMGRMLARTIEEDIGPVVVENRAGAGGRIGAEVVARAAPDGYTLLLGQDSYLAQAEVFYPNLSYKTSSFTPIGIASRLNNTVVVHPSVPVHSLKELIDYAKANPGKLNFGSIGIGSATHLLLERFKAHTGVDVVHVPYQGQAPQMAALLAGDIQVSFQILAGPTPAAIKAGKLRLLVILGPQRSKVFPDAPTVDEVGFKGFYWGAWFGLVAPAGTPAEIVQRISRTVQKAVNNEKNAQILASFSMTAGDGTPQELAAQMRRDMELYTEINKKLKLKFE